jgi:hypothetical protein
LCCTVVEVTTRLMKATLKIVLCYWYFYCHPLLHCDFEFASDQLVIFYQLSKLVVGVLSCLLLLRSRRVSIL